MKNKILFAALLLFMIFCFSACGENNSDQAAEKVQVSAADFYGTWKGTGQELSTLTLGADGSYRDIADGVSIIGTYTVDTASGTLTVNESEYGMVFTYGYELSGDDLTLQLNGGRPRTFVRQ